MKRISIVGSGGSGKSTLAIKLSRILNIPVYHLDNLFWNKDKSHVDRDTFNARLEEVIAKDSWIIDGDYKRTYELRFKESDTIIFLDYPLEVCLEGAKSRVGKSRPDIPWIEESFDPEFEAWIKAWRETKLPQLEALLTKYKDKKNIIRLYSRSEADRFLESISK